MQNITLKMSHFVPSEFVEAVDEGKVSLRPRPGDVEALEPLHRVIVPVLLVVAGLGPIRSQPVFLADGVLGQPALLSYSQ